MDAQEIRRILMEDWEYFGPDGVGWHSPTAALARYSANPEDFELDLVAVKERKQKAGASVNHEAHDTRIIRDTSNAALARDTSNIRRMYSEGYCTERIAEVTGINPILVGKHIAKRLAGRHIHQRHEPPPESELRPSPETAALIAGFERAFGSPDANKPELLHPAAVAPEQYHMSDFTRGFTDGLDGRNVPEGASRGYRAGHEKGTDEAMKRLNAQDAP